MLHFESAINNNQNEDSDQECVSEANFATSCDGFFYYEYKDHLFCCMTIIGQIEGHNLLPSDHKTTKYENIIPRILSVECDKNVEGLLLILNTVGGDIEAGMAIAEMIAGMKKPSLSLVLGGGHSIGIPLAVAAKKSLMAESASMTVHPVRMSGVVMGVPQQLAYFQNMQERIINFVADNSSVSRERFREMMLAAGNLVSDFGTVLSGTEAVKEGIIENNGNISDALEELVNMC